MIFGTVIKFYTVGKVCQQGTEGVLTFYYNDISVKLIINLGNINLIEIILLKEKSFKFFFFLTVQWFIKLEGHEYKSIRENNCWYYNHLHEYY